jgi:hypothetical protein
MGGPVIDRTGLTGPFDFTLEYVYDPAEEHDLVTIAQKDRARTGTEVRALARAGGDDRHRSFGETFGELTARICGLLTRAVLLDEMRRSISVALPCW